MFIPNTQNDNAKFYLIDFATNTETISFTSCDKNVVFNGKIYKNCQFIDDISFNDLNKIDDIKIRFLNKDNIEIEQLLNSKIVIYLSAIDAQNAMVEAGNIICQNAVAIFRGFVDNITANENLCEITVRSNVAKLNYSNSSLFSPICRECLGSAKCRVDLEQYKANGTILEIISQDCIVGNHRENKNVAVGYYKYGTIKFLSGKLRGVSMQIKDEVDGKIYLLRNTKLVEIGNSYEIFAGCNKTLSVCKNKFNNVVNFCGEPYINVNT